MSRRDSSRSDRTERRRRSRSSSRNRHNKRPSYDKRNDRDRDRKRQRLSAPPEYLIHTQTYYGETFIPSCNSENHCKLHGKKKRQKPNSIIFTFNFIL